MSDKTQLPGQTGIVLMGSLPEFGQLNPLFAIAECLIARGYDVHFASGHSCQKRMDQFNDQLNFFPDTAKKHITFHDMGEEDCINDHNYMASASPEEFAHFKEVLAQGPRNSYAFSGLIDLVMHGGLGGRKAVTDRFIDLVNKLKPDILVLDQFTSCFVEAARVTGVDYIVTAPASPSTLSSPSPMFEALSGTNLESPMTLKSRILNTWYFCCVIPRVIAHPRLTELRKYRRDVLKLPPTNMAMDSSPFSKFHPTWTNQKAIISPNVDFRQQTPFDKVIFVGSCVQRRLPISANDGSVYDLSIIKWLDDCLLNGDHVVYMNMGTIFRYNQQEVDEVFQAVRNLNKRRPGGHGVNLLWKVPKGKFDLGALPAQIKIVEWLQDPLIVYEHKAVKVCINHGGGNSFNEALTYGIPQLVCSQWFDTIDYGVSSRTSGIGLSSENPGRLESQDITDKITRLLTEKSFIDKTLLWRLKSKAAGGANAAADVIETYIDSRRHPRDDHFVNVEPILNPLEHQHMWWSKALLVSAMVVLLSVVALGAIVGGESIAGSHPANSSYSSLLPFFNTVLK